MTGFRCAQSRIQPAIALTPERFPLHVVLVISLALGLTLGMTCRKKNQPPGVPSIPSGPASGRKGDTLRFSTVAEDPDGDSVAVRFDWGDGTTSDWSDLVPGGSNAMATHAWQRLGTYPVRAQARDAKGTASACSGERQLTISSYVAIFGGTGWDVGNSVQQTTDGGYIIAGLTNSLGSGGYDAWLIKTDASGRKVWDKTLGGAYDDAGYSVRQTADGGYIITGYADTSGAIFTDVWLIKTDAEGNRVWDKTFGGTGYDEGNSVRLTAGGGYIIVGSTMSYGAGGHDVWLVKTDASGDKAWDRTFGGPGDDYGLSVEQTPDKGFILAGLTDSYGAGSDDVWLIKTDSSGNRVWDKTLGGPSGDLGGSVRQTPDGGYIIAGVTDSYGAGGHDVWLIKTDASGNKVWDKTFGGTGDDGGYSVQRTSDHGYVVAGHTGVYGDDRSDVWLVKSDGSGREIWNKTFGGIGKDVGSSVQQTSDGGYVVVGYTNSYGAGEGDVWLIKTDAEGN